MEEPSAADGGTSITTRKRLQSAGHEGTEYSNGAFAIACQENGRGGHCPPPSKRSLSVPAAAGNGASEDENGSSSESELEQTLAQQGNSTAKSNKWAMTHFTRWLEEHNFSHPEDPIPTDLLKRHHEPELLNKWLARYAEEARRQDGKRYPATSVYFLLAALARQTRIDDPTAPNFLSSSNPQFRPLHESLEATFRRLKETEVPSEAKNPQPLTSEEEELLWTSGSLSCSTPKGLLRAVYFLNVKHLGLVGGNKHRLLKLSQFKRLNNPPRYTFSYTDSSPAVVEKGSTVSFWSRKQSQSQPPSSSPSNSVKTVVLNAVPAKGVRSYVYILDSYLQRIPPEAFGKDTFYLQPLVNTLTTAPHQWYSLNPMGRNSLSRIMREMCVDAGITGARNFRWIQSSSVARRVSETLESLAGGTTGTSPQQGPMVLSPQIVVPPLSFLMQGAMQVPPLPSPTTDTPTTPVNWGGELSLASFTSQLSQNINQTLRAIPPKMPTTSPSQQSAAQPLNTGQTPTKCGVVNHVNHINIAPKPHLTLLRTSTATTSSSTATNPSHQLSPHTPTPPQPRQIPTSRPLPPQSLVISNPTQNLPPNPSHPTKTSENVKSAAAGGHPNCQETPTQQPPVEGLDSCGLPENQETESIHLPPCTCPRHRAPQHLTFNNCHVTIYLTPLQQPPPASSS